MIRSVTPPALTVMTPNAVLFDLDGTLVDSREDIAAACNHTLSLHGRARLPVDVVSSFVGDGARVLLARAFGVSADDPLLDHAASDFRSYYEAHPADHAALLPGVREALRVLAGVPLGIVTNKPRAIAVLLLARMEIDGSFDVVRAGGDGPLKPDPWPLVDALRELDVEPESAWVIGDGPQDIGAGRAARCFTIAVRNGFGSGEALAAAGPSLTIDSLLELVELVGRLQPRR